MIEYLQKQLQRRSSILFYKSDKGDTANGL